MMANTLDALNAQMPLTALLVIGVFAFVCTLMIPALLSGGRPAHVADAAHAYIMQGFGLFLMIISAIPTLQSVLANVAFTGREYLGFLLIFAVGGLTFLSHEEKAQKIEESAKAAVRAIFHGTLRVIGNMVALLSILWLILNIVAEGSSNTYWWTLPLIMLLFGLLLSWASHVSLSSRSLFQTTTLLGPSPKMAHKKTIKPVRVKRS